MSRVKNRAPAQVQITAEQFLRDASQSRDEAFGALPVNQRVEDSGELSEYRARKRGEFEERVRRSKGDIKGWVRYAAWENELDRSRSVFERALDTHPTSVQLWLTYTDMELKNRNVQHARNLLDRAVTLLPRVEQLWYKYVYLEELLGNMAGARQVFERWMKWEPEAKAWQAYIKLEERYGELDRAGLIYERLVALQPLGAGIWVKWAKFEEERGNVEKAREVFKMAFEFFGDELEGLERARPVYTAFATMETRLKEYERARVAYTYALERIPGEAGKDLSNAYSAFEKQYGAEVDVDASVYAKRRVKYEEELKRDNRNYDAWLGYARMEEEAWRSLQAGDKTLAEEIGDQGKRVQEIYERAIAQVPLKKEKQHWRRYIFVWLRYAMFEEMERKDYDRAREVYKAAVNAIPHKSFTFSKLWLMFAKFEIRRLDLGTARKVLGTAIGMCPKPSLFKRYVELEIELREFDRARMLYEKYLEFDPSDPTAWVAYAELEVQLADPTRARGIYELGLTQNLSTPEILWKSYIDFEVSEQGNRGAARALYERLVELSAHVKVWVAYALFEGGSLTVAEETENGEEVQKLIPGDINLARGIFKRGYDHLKSRDLKNERLALLEAWETFETTYGSPEGVDEVKRLKPTGGVRRLTDQGTGQVTDVSDLIFPEDEATNPGPSKFLQMARAWKESQEQRGGAADVE